MVSFAELPTVLAWSTHRKWSFWFLTVLLFFELSETSYVQGHIHHFLMIWGISEIKQSPNQAPVKGPLIALWWGGVQEPGSHMI